MLTAERNTQRRYGERYAFPVAAGAKIYEGALVVLDGGYAKPGAAAAGLVATGRATATVDNTAGDAGDQVVQVEPGIFKWDNSTTQGDVVDQACVGLPCYVLDDATVAKTAAPDDGNPTRSAAGLVVAIDPDGVWVNSHL